jgi:hypothetical protein
MIGSGAGLFHSKEESTTRYDHISANFSMQCEEKKSIMLLDD